MKFLALCFAAAGVLSAGDTAYARKVITHLASKKCFGRGYLKNGLGTAAKFLEDEMRAQGLRPLFGRSYRQAFRHVVNTFPGNCDLQVEGQKLVTGNEFIPAITSASLKGKYILYKKDSVTYRNREGTMSLKKVKKLTFSVGDRNSGITAFETIRALPDSDSLRAEVNLASKLVNFKSENLGGFFPGTANTDSMVVFTAHYDHLGGIGKKVYFPGANDNASGVSMVLNLIRHYQAHPPRLTTVFIFFAGEEAGLLGSAYFVKNSPVDLGRIRFLINLDMMGTGDDGIMVVNGALHEEQFSRISALNEEKALVKEVRKRGKAANSDHYWFTEAGVPAFFIYTLGGRSAYHDVHDTAAGLPLTDYTDIFSLLTDFSRQL